MLTHLHHVLNEAQLSAAHKLINSGQFRLPGKKALQPSDTVIEIVVVDVTEQPIERPNKSNVDTTVARRNDTPRKRK